MIQCGSYLTWASTKIRNNKQLHSQNVTVATLEIISDSWLITAKWIMIAT